MGLFPVSPEKERDLWQRMVRVGLKESDLEEKFIRSQGKGGQKVNKSATCVYLKHLPTGLEVKCQGERTQALNRFLARRILVEKLEEKILKKESEEKQRIEKIRRQKRKRSRQAKEKMLEEKRHQSEKKESRRIKFSPEDF
ncbi:MAG: peptide chain release factor family protein [Candidatus Saccharicenans sp.]